MCVKFASLHHLPLGDAFDLSHLLLQELSSVTKTLLGQKHVFYLKHGFPIVVSELVKVFAPYQILFGSVLIRYVCVCQPPPSAPAQRSGGGDKDTAWPEEKDDRHWVSGLVEGNYIDGRSPTGSWEMVECEVINEDRTQLAVTWGSGERAGPAAWVICRVCVQAILLFLK